MRVACFCGAEFHADTDLDVCPNCRTPVCGTRQSLEDELDQIIAQRSRGRDHMDFIVGTLVIVGTIGLVAALVGLLL